jgi:hypothetical protein
LQFKEQVPFNFKNKYQRFNGNRRPLDQGCGAGTGTGQNRIHLGTLEPEPYSEYGSGSGSEYKEMKKTQKN